jgi:hypothetical protein
MNSSDYLDSWSSYTSSPPATLEDVLYQHLQYWRYQEQPRQLIERFSNLFLGAGQYSDPAVANALFKLADRPGAEREFKFVLNRCCYTLINFWYMQPRYHWAIPELVKQLENFKPVPVADTQIRRLQTLVKNFTTTEQFAALKRLHKIFEFRSERKIQALTGTAEEQPLISRISHYPFLYNSSLLTKDSGPEQRQNINDMRQTAENKLAIQLARYHTYLRQISDTSKLENPTLLGVVDLNHALEYYTGKIDGLRSHKDQARWFLTYSKTARSFGDFKDDFVDYLIHPIVREEPRYKNNHFTRNLRHYVRETLSEFDSQQLNSFILVESCRRLFNFLVVNSPQKPVFRNFRHLIGDLGYPLTVGLLLRIVLFCSAAKPWLERCFSVLFSLHENRFCKDVPWLVDSLEHTNVALVTNFNGLGYQF